MSLTENEKKTLDAYDSFTEKWAKVHDDADFWVKEIDAFKSHLPSGKIIEIGVGSGRDAKYFIKDKSYEYLGADISKNLLSLAVKNNPTGKFIQLSIYDLEAQETIFDGFWCAAVLLHIPKDRLIEALHSLNKTLRVDGIGLISTKLGEGEGLEKWNINPSKSRLIVYYSKEELINGLKKTGFEIVWENTIFEKQNTWQSFIVKKEKNIL